MTADPTTIGLPEQPLTAAAADPPAAHLRARLDEQLRALLTHQDVAEADTDPEGVHQLRVSVRRLRAALKADESVHDLGNAEELLAELKWLGGELGPVRDLDVLLEHFREQAGGFEDKERAAVGRLLSGLVADRERARKRMLRAVRGRRYGRLLKALAAAATSPLPEGTTRQEAGKPADLTGLIVRPYRKLHKAAVALDDESPDEELHALRIRGKRLRYAAELAVPTGGKRVKKLINATKRLQDVLGEHQDAVIAEERVRTLLRKHTGVAEAFVAGRLVERERARQAATRSTWHAAFLEVDELARALS